MFDITGQIFDFVSTSHLHDIAPMAFRLSRQEKIKHYEWFNCGAVDAAVGTSDSKERVE